VCGDQGGQGQHLSSCVRWSMGVLPLPPHLTHSVGTEFPSPPTNNSRSHVAFDEVMAAVSPLVRVSRSMRLCQPHSSRLHIAFDIGLP